MRLCRYTGWSESAIGPDNILYIKALKYLVKKEKASLRALSFILYVLLVVACQRHLSFCYKLH